MAIVYRHWRKDKTEVFYVGIGNKESRAFDFFRRNKVWKGIKKRTDVDVEIVARDLTWEDACEIEQLMIQEYGRIDLGTGRLSNLTNGGDGNFGTKQSEESKRKRGDSNRGKERTEDTKKLMSEVRKGIVFSAEHIENLRKSHLGKLPPNAKQVIDLQTGIAFDSLRNGCHSLNVNYKNEFARQSRKSKNVRFEII
jgi:hypothetical protein